MFTGNISTIWPLFGISNQLLAGTALLIATVLLVKHGKVRYMWVTAIPSAFIAVITVWAGLDNIFGNYIPSGHYLLALLSAMAAARLNTRRG